MTTGLPTAGWYDDPERPGHLRWWDGSAWTDNRMAAQPSTVGVVPSAPAPGAYAGTAGAADPQAWSPGSSEWASGATSTITYRQQTAAPTTELATAGDRLLAALLDGVVAFALLFATGIAGGLASVFPEGLAGLLSFVMLIGVYALLFISTTMGTGRLGQSYGKHLMGIKVVSTTTGAPIGSPAAFGRSIVATLGAYVFGLGLLWILWDPQRQGWHDKAVSSVVIKDPRPSKLDPVSFVRAIFETG